MQVPHYRYQDGVVLGQMDSQETWGDAGTDKVIKRVIALARPCSHGFELVIMCEVEVIDGVSEDSSDTGDIELPVEIWSIPFPFDRTLRKALLRLVRDQIDFCFAAG